MLNQSRSRKSEEFHKKADRFIRDLEELHKNNPELGLQQFDNLISASQYLFLYELVFQYLPRGIRVLDWGCGNGHFSFFLIQQKYDVSAYSLENIPPLLMRTDKNRFVFVQGQKNDPVSIPFPQNSFDAVVSVGVLEHVREMQGDEAASLAEIQRILRPGGHFIGYHLPSASSWIEALSACYPNKHSHHWRYKKTGLQQMLKNSGFTSIYMLRYGFLPRWLSTRYPAWFKNSFWAAGFYNKLDTGLGRVLPIFCTNFAVVTQKIKGD